MKPSKKPPVRTSEQAKAARTTRAERLRLNKPREWVTEYPHGSDGKPFAVRVQLSGSATDPDGRPIAWCSCALEAPGALQSFEVLTETGPYDQPFATLDALAEKCVDASKDEHCTEWQRAAECVRVVRNLPWDQLFGGPR